MERGRKGISLNAEMEMSPNAQNRGFIKMVPSNSMIQVKPHFDEPSNLNQGGRRDDCWVGYAMVLIPSSLISSSSMYRGTCDCNPMLSS